MNALWHGYVDYIFLGVNKNACLFILSFIYLFGSLITHAIVCAYRVHVTYRSSGKQNGSRVYYYYYYYYYYYCKDPAQTRLMGVDETSPHRRSCDVGWASLAGWLDSMLCDYKVQMRKWCFMRYELYLTGAWPGRSYEARAST